MSPPERRALLATFAGWGLDGMDVQIYSFVIPTLIAAWGISRGQAGILGTVTLLLSALGGWLAGILADRVGRVRLLQVTVAWYAFFTFLSGFTHSFPELLLTRGLQGLGFGGEWAAGSVLMGELADPRYRGRAVGTVQSGWAVGWGVAVLASTVFFSLLPAGLAWRAMFWLGILPALLVVYIRRHVREPEVFEATQRKLEAGARTSSREIFEGGLLRTTVIASLMTTGIQGGYYAITTWLPTYLQSTRHLSVLNRGGYLAVVILGSFTGYLVAAHLADRIGRRRKILLFAVLSAATVAVYAYLPISDRLMLYLGFPLGFFASGIFSGLGPYLTELYPTRVRGAGQGFAYNFGRGVGALFPGLVGFLSANLSLGTAIALFAVVAYALVVLMLALLPETAGKELVAYD
ncbi:MAG: MFS transporter [Clostridia bacterium]|nr:MFS transporter [Clostridia bacterium]MCL6522249.1 MFS transporter [Bacillota bacterium]